MNRETFIELLSNRELLKSTSSGELMKVVEEYPYCQTSRILLTMSLFNEGHFKYDTELAKTALYAGNRKMLKYHIDRLKFEEVLTDVAADELPEPEVEVSMEIESEAAPAEVPGLLNEDEVEVEDAVDAAPEIVPEEQSEIPQTEEEIALEQQAVDKPAQDVEAETEEEPVEIPESVAPTENSEPEPEKVLPEEAEVATEPEPQAEAGKGESGKDRLAQLKAIVEARLRQIELERTAERKTAAPEPVEEESSIEPEIEETEAERPASELIDDFIRNEPSISRSQTTFFNPVDAAKESVVDDENIVSETLAQIYFDQKHYQKAIKIYRKLSLIYPEKSSYFAAQIEKAVEELKK